MPGAGSTTHGHLIAPEVSGRERTTRGLPATSSTAWVSAPKPPALSPFNHSVTALWGLQYPVGTSSMQPPSLG